jgi:hypothetical protein
MFLTDQADDESGPSITGTKEGAVTTSTGTDPIRRLDDDAAHALAMAYLKTILGGDHVPAVHWDPDHHLQGHLNVRGEELVLIAVRTTDHTPLVLSEADWDSFHRRGVSSAA